jgi:hypothetical protein
MHWGVSEFLNAEHAVCWVKRGPRNDGSLMFPAMNLD